MDGITNMAGALWVLGMIGVALLSAAGWGRTPVRTEQPTTVERQRRQRGPNHCAECAAIGRSATERPDGSRSCIDCADPSVPWTEYKGRPLYLEAPLASEYWYEETMRARRVLETMTAERDAARAFNAEGIDLLKRLRAFWWKSQDAKRGGDE